MIRRLFITALLCGVCYLAGMSAERRQQQLTCQDWGGEWMVRGYCSVN